MGKRLSLVVSLKWMHSMTPVIARPLPPYHAMIYLFWTSAVKWVHEYFIICASVITQTLLFYQIVVLNKAKERIQPHQNNQEEEDPDIKKIKKVSCWCDVIMRRNTKSNKERHLVVFWLAGAKFHARLAVPEEVEAYCPGLHLLTSCWEHEEEEPDRLQHGGSRDGVRPPAVHPGQLFPQTAPHGRQLQETPHQPWRR